VQTRSPAQDPELRIQWTDQVTHARGYAVIDTMGSIAYGGVRIDSRVEWDDLILLARLRTLRYQLARVPLAGAEVALAWDPEAPDRYEVLGRFLASLSPLMDSVLTLGPDAHVSAQALDKVLESNKLPWRMAAAQSRQGWPVERWQLYQEIMGGAVGRDQFRHVQSALSVAEVAHAAAQQLFRREVTVAIMGSGPFALAIARSVQELGAKVVAIGSTSAAIHSKNGLRPEMLDSGDLVSSDPGEAMFITGDELCALPVDVLITSSNQDTITVENVGRLRCGLVVEAATHSVSSNGETVLIARGIPVLPSFAATVGPTFVSDACLRGEVRTLEEALASLRRNVQSTARELVRLSATLRISLREAGQRLAFHHRFGKQSLPRHSQRMIAFRDDGSGG
jgi:glutamate dehydrogenase/leucine dehydrogenase